jgi:hypothetical protein
MRVKCASENIAIADRRSLFHRVNKKEIDALGNGAKRLYPGLMQRLSEREKSMSIQTQMRDTGGVTHLMAVPLLVAEKY